MKLKLQVENRKLSDLFRKGCITCNLRRAFTLLELLVVISILGILAALTVPALKNLGKSNVTASAARQLLDDVGHARQLAIANHTTVYMVFVPTNFWGPINWNNLSYNEQVTATNLSESQLTGYNFISQGKLGDQPGQRQTDWQYLSTWQALPENSFIASWKFQPRSSYMPVNLNGQNYNIYGFSSAYEYPATKFPFPTATNFNSYLQLPFIAFNYLGQLTTNGVDPSYRDEYIPLAQGSVSYGYNGATKSPTMSVISANDIQENPPGNSTGSMLNLVHIDALTGRAHLEFQKVQ